MASTTRGASRGGARQSAQSVQKLSPGGSGRGSSEKVRERRRMVAIFLLPALAFYGVFFMVPVLGSFFLSFVSWDGLGEMSFVGVANYAGLLGDGTFWLSFTNTLGVLFIVGGSVFLASFLLMSILRGMQGGRFIRAVVFFPNIVAPVVLAIAWGFILNPQTGLVNTTLGAIGLASLQQVWLGPDLIMSSVMAALAWIYAGFFATILLSAVDRIPAYYYEACDIEGASRFQKFRYVTLPMSWDIVSVASVLWVITAIKVFEFIYAFGAVSGSPPRESWTLGIHLYMITLGNRSPIYEMGYGSAIAVFMVLLTALLVFLVFRFMRREPIDF